MPILDYATKVPVAKTLEEIEACWKRLTSYRWSTRNNRRLRFFALWRWSFHGPRNRLRKDSCTRRRNPACGRTAWIRLVTRRSLFRGSVLATTRIITSRVPAVRESRKRSNSRSHTAFADQCAAFSSYRRSNKKNSGHFHLIPTPTEAIFGWIISLCVFYQGLRLAKKLRKLLSPGRSSYQKSTALCELCDRRLRWTTDYHQPSRLSFPRFVNDSR